MVKMKKEEEEDNPGVGADSVPPQILFPGHNLLAEIIPHGHNPLADIVLLPQILSPPPPLPPASNQCLAVPVFFCWYKPRPLFASSQFSTHTPSHSPFPPSVPQCYQSTFSPDLLAAALNNVPSALRSCTWCALQLQVAISFQLSAAALWMKKSAMPLSAF